jgi:hypothetical protein
MNNTQPLDNQVQNQNDSYRAPEIHEIGSAIDLVQGGGGHAGSDVKYYWYHLPNE